MTQAEIWAASSSTVMKSYSFFPDVNGKEASPAAAARRIFPKIEREAISSP